MATTYAEVDAPLPPPEEPVPSPLSPPVSVVEQRRARLAVPPATDRVWGWLGPLGVSIIAFLLRLNRLSVPHGKVFDEVYYQKDAWDLLRFGVERNKEGTKPGYVVHPPLGKWAIAIGEKIWGPENAFGWRIAAVVFGTLSVFVLCRLGRRMFRSTLLGCMAGLLLTLDGLHFVQSRMAMLDIFLSFWVLAAAACLVADRDVVRARLAAQLTENVPYPGPKLGIRWWRLAAGVCLGAACATKWSGLYFIAVFGLFSLAWGIGMRRAAGISAPFRATIWREMFPLAGSLLLLPLVVYVSSWAGWFASSDGWRRTCRQDYGFAISHPARCGAFHGFVEYHFEVFRFHRDLKYSHTKNPSPHTYQSDPWRWMLLARPVAYFYSSPQARTDAELARGSATKYACSTENATKKNTCKSTITTIGPDDPDRLCAKGTCSKEILGIGTPAIWWASILALLALAWRWVSTRDWRAGFIVGTFAVGYFSWAYPPYRTEFLFYALPIVPFLCLALAYCAGWALGGPDASLVRRRVAGAAVGFYLLLVLANFAYLYPILSAKVLPYAEWKSRMWFGSWI